MRFQASQGLPLEQRVRIVEQALQRMCAEFEEVYLNSAQSPAPPLVAETTEAASTDGTIEEADVDFDDSGGHDHTGTNGTGKQISHANLTGVTPNQHHNQQHVLATNVGLGADHTMSGATAGHCLRASSATAAAFAQVQHSDLGGVTPNQHHNQQHSLTGADHTASGLTAGHVLTALTPTTFGFQAPAASTAKFAIGPWVRNDINNSGVTAQAMPFGAPSTGVHAGVVMPYAGTLWAITVSLDGDVGTAGDNYYALTYKNGSSVGITAQISGGAGTEKTAYDTDSGVSFAAGDVIQAYDQFDGSPDARGCVVFIIVSFS